jgi:hypothetical protein
MSKPSTEVAIRPEAELALDAELAGLFGDAAGEGLENVTSSEIVLPRLGIIQPTSPMVEAGTAKPGDIANLLTGENYGTSVQLYPLMFWSTRIFWESKALNSAILCSSKDGRNGTLKTDLTGGGVCARCPQAQWHDGEGPACTEFKNLLVIPFAYATPEEELDAILNTAPTVFSAKRTSVKALNQFLSTAVAIRAAGKPVPLFSSKWALSTEKKENDKGKFFLPVFKRLGYVDTKEMFGYLRSTYQEAKASQDRFVVVDDNREGDAAPSYINEDGDDNGAPEF